MSLSRWQPFSEIRRIHDQMDRMFENLLQPSSMQGLSAAALPLVDVYEEKNNVIVKAEVPGLSKDQLEVTASDDSITLKGEFKSEEKTETKGFIQQERRMGSFFRSIPMPNLIKPDQVKASFKDGILTITAPLAEEEKQKETKVNIES